MDVREIKRGLFRMADMSQLRYVLGYKKVYDCRLLVMAASWVASSDRRRY